ncbi:two-component sensor histidine kinase [Streptomyces sp. RB110-1]|uniref:sensor histidine kinase n=1 Tax=unclassified Streptomyces TaxID=2593676 RepID=UPI0019022E3A|nr:MULTISPECIES: histidine kinase [unclassified Streptomyces]MBK0376150.1 two-component sensor histidine kinase [Streptomyces sp. RB110-1]MBK0387476.1 two-component sensor histidine kinase [Streptomyces sp. RB110-2]
MVAKGTEFVRIGCRFRCQERAVAPVCAVLAPGGVAVALLTAPAGGLQAAATTAVAVLGVLVVAWRRHRPRTAAWAAAGVAAASALGTLFSSPPTTDRATGLATLAEIAALLLLVCLVARYAPVRQAAALCSILGLLSSTALFRLHVPPSAVDAAAQSAFFALGAIAAAATGGGLRSLETRRVRAVREARQHQRLELAADLHDFAAHDVSAVVVLAQAAQVIGADRPEELLPLLRQIEESGQQALGSMDRTVHMLRSPGDSPGSPDTPRTTPPPGTYGLEDIVDVVDRFRATGPADVRLNMDRRSERVRRVPHEVAGTAHRVVVEALTNVRRHAATAPWVAVSVLLDGAEDADPVLTVSVANGPPAPGRTGGGHLGDRVHPAATGLAGLSERTRALGGTLRFGAARENHGARTEDGPHGRPGWQVTATFPLPT